MKQQGRLKGNRVSKGWEVRGKLLGEKSKEVRRASPQATQYTGLQHNGDGLRVKEAEQEGCPDGSYRVGEKVRLARQGQSMDEMPSVAREAAKNLQHEWVTTCPRHSASWYFACWNVGGRAADGGKQARVSFCEGDGGPKTGKGGVTSGDGADNLELEKLM
eukprot:5090914-Pleurochrysis_carterae.AAC.1